MRFDKFTIKAQEAVQEAQELAESKKQQQILAAHLLEVLLTQEQGIVIPLFKKLGIDTDSVLEKTMASVNKLPQISGTGAPGQAYVSAELRDTFNLAWEEAGKLKDEFVKHRAPLAGAGRREKHRRRQDTQRGGRPKGKHLSGIKGNQG